MDERYPTEEQLRIAETVRAACIAAALAGYEDAGMHGLCHEGAWECAVDAMRALKLRTLLSSPPRELPQEEQHAPRQEGEQKIDARRQRHGAPTEEQIAQAAQEEQ